MLDAEFLSRIQFAFTISFHILFPAFSIGLATFLMIMEALYLRTKNPLYLTICKFWMKIFALTFGMGVVSGIVMEFQLGTNWSGFTKMVGPVLGALFTYEVLTAFFIEAGFLGVMLFGWNKVGPKLHFLSTCLVFLGVTLSAFWILSANSWMQTPSGAHLVNGEFLVTSYWQVVFNPSVIGRFIHMLLSAYITTLFVIAGVSAFYLARKVHVKFSRKCLSFSLWVLLFLVPAQIFVGDAVGIVVHDYQPIKTAAIEAVWTTQKGAPLVLLAWPNMKTQSNDYSIQIPHLAALMNTHEWNGNLEGLESVSPEDQPYVPLVFYSFRIMVGLGILMLLIVILGLVQRFRKKLYESPWFHRMLIMASPIGFIALISGWFTAETGRQPWAVYNILRTSEASSKVSISNVWISLILMVVVYGIIFGIFYFRYLGRIISKGPEGKIEIEMPFSYLNNKEIV